MVPAFREVVTWSVYEFPPRSQLLQGMGGRLRTPATEAVGHSQQYVAVTATLRTLLATQTSEEGGPHVPDPNPLAPPLPPAFVQVSALSKAVIHCLDVTLIPGGKQGRWSRNLSWQKPVLRMCRPPPKFAESTLRAVCSRLKVKYFGGEGPASPNPPPCAAAGE